jgi:hypothetical protein
LVPLAAWAANLPEFDIKALCSGAGQTGDSSSKFTLEECVNNEMLAHDELRRRADALSDESVKSCTKSVSEGHPGSYLALLGCLAQSNKVVGEAAADNQQQSRSKIATKAIVAPAAAGPTVTISQASPSPGATQAESPNPTVAPNAFHFTHDLGLHSVDPDVKLLQVFLNTHGFPIAADGPGSPGHEVEKFGESTKAALKKFQEAHAKDLGIAGATGHFGPATRKYINGL